MMVVLWQIMYYFGFGCIVFITGFSISSWGIYVKKAFLGILYAHRSSFHMGLWLVHVVFVDGHVFGIFLTLNVYGTCFDVISVKQKINLLLLSIYIYMY